MKKPFFKTSILTLFTLLALSSYAEAGYRVTNPNAFGYNSIFSGTASSQSSLGIEFGNGHQSAFNGSSFYGFPYGGGRFTGGIGGFIGSSLYWSNGRFSVGMRFGNRLSSFGWPYMGYLGRRRVAAPIVRPSNAKTQRDLQVATQLAVTKYNRYHARLRDEARRKKIPSAKTMEPTLPGVDDQNIYPQIRNKLPENKKEVPKESLRTKDGLIVVNYY